MSVDGQPSFSVPPPNGLADPTAQPVFSGFSGFIVYESNINGGISKYLIRAQSCSLKGTQNIQSIPDIDGSVDLTRYRLEPFEARGNIVFPLDSAPGSMGYEAFARLYSDTVERSKDGRLKTREVPGSRNVLIRYNSDLSYRFLDVAVNKMTLACNAREPLNITAELVARGREGPFNGNSSQVGNGLDEVAPSSGRSNAAPVRVVTYNDVSIDIESSPLSGGGIVVNTPPSITRLPLIRSFTVNIDNKVEAVHTLSGTLAAYDLVAAKRTISGNINFYGRNRDIADYALLNEVGQTSRCNLSFNVRFGNVTKTLFKLRGVVFKLEQMDIRNETLESTMEFMAFGDQQFNYEAISALENPGSSANGNRHPYPFV